MRLLKCDVFYPRSLLSSISEAEFGVGTQTTNEVLHDPTKSALEKYLPSISFSHE